MRFTVITSLLASLIFASTAYAATLTVVADAATYGPGDPITLTVTGTINPTLEAATNFFVSLDVPGNVTFLSHTADQAFTPGMFGNANWSVGGVEGQVTGSELRVFDQIHGVSPAPFGNNFNGVDTAFVTATATFYANAPGVVTFDFGGQTNFFGISGASPGVSVNIPEPATAALVALGLLGLGMRGRV